MKTWNYFYPGNQSVAAKEFYLQLGFELITEAPFQGGQQWIQLGFPSSTVSIRWLLWFDNMPPACINGPGDQTDNLAKGNRRVNRQRHQRRQDRRNAGGKFAAVIDPDGNRLSLHESWSSKPRNRAGLCTMLFFQSGIAYLKTVSKFVLTVSYYLLIKIWIVN